MSGGIEWVDADAASNVLEWTTTPGEWTEGPLANVGTAVRFGNVIIEGPLEELNNLAVGIHQAIFEMQDSLNERESG